MFNYVNEEKFYAWYKSVAKQPVSQRELLERAAKQYMSSHRGLFTLPAGETLSGSEESYPFRFENIGCCGASTIYFYF